MLEYKLLNTSTTSFLYEALLTEEFLNEYICKCTISVDKNNKWTISQWYANRNYQHQGYGRMTMKYLVDELLKLYGKPSKLMYIWNNANKYVYDWIHNNFDARLSDNAIKILKYSDEDVKEGHEYYLDVNKFLKYFEERKKS